MESTTVISINFEDPKLIETLKEMHPSDIAGQLRGLKATKIREILRLLPDELTAEIIAELPLETSVQLFETMRLNRLSGIIGEMFTDDAADVLGQISSTRLREIMSRMTPEDAEQMRSLLRYPEDSAGGIMQAEFVAISEEWMISEAIEALQKHETIHEEDPFYIYVIDKQERLRGVLRVRDLLFGNPKRKIKDLMNSEVRCVSVHADQEEIGKLFHRYHFASLPVVDDFQRLCGIVTADDAIDVIEEEATEDMQRMIGLSGEEMIDTPWNTAVKNRLPWLFVNLGTAFLAGFVVSSFQETIAQYAALAVFLPIIAGQGGNAGTQTLTILVRSLALGEIHLESQKRVLIKELSVGFLTGLATGLVVGIIGWLWKGNLVLGIIASVAMIGNLICAAIAGVLIPLGLKALKIDPALASAIMLTTVTDVIGFFLFLGLATLGFHHFPPHP